jgi:hypothetical protein
MPTKLFDAFVCLKACQAEVTEILQLTDTTTNFKRVVIISSPEWLMQYGKFRISHAHLSGPMLQKNCNM